MSKNSDTQKRKIVKVFEGVSGCGQLSSPADSERNFAVCSFNTQRHQDWNRIFEAFLSPVLCTWKRSVDGCQSLANSQRCGHYDLAKRLLVSWLDELVTAIVSNLNVSVLALMECNFSSLSPPTEPRSRGHLRDRRLGNHNHVLMPLPPPPPTPPQWEGEN